MGESNLPHKSATVLSEPKFGPPQSKIPGSAPVISIVVTNVMTCIKVVCLSICGQPSYDRENFPTASCFVADRFHVIY